MTSSSTTNGKVKNAIQVVELVMDGLGLGGVEERENGLGRFLEWAALMRMCSIMLEVMKQQTEDEEGS